MKRLISSLLMGALFLGAVPLSSADDSLPNLSVSVLRIDNYRMFMKFTSEGTVTTKNGKEVAYKISVLDPSGVELAEKVSTLSAEQLADGMEMRTFYLPKWEKLLTLPALAEGENYTLKVTIDRNDFVDESDETDNSLSIPLPIGSGSDMPDLQASGAEVKSMDASAKTVTFNYGLSNNSSIDVAATVRDAANFFLVDGEFVGMSLWSTESETSYLSAMGASTQEYTVDGSSLSAGTHSFMVCVDAYNDPKSTLKKGLIAESDELSDVGISNNCSSVDFSVSTDLNASNLRLASYDGLRLVLDITNDGLLPVSTLSYGPVQILFQFYDTDGNLIFEKNRNLELGEWSDQNASVGLLLSKFKPVMDAVAAGKVLVAKVSVDPTGEVAELNKSNNTIELSLTLNANQVPDLYAKEIAPSSASDSTMSFTYKLGNSSETNVSAKTDKGANTVFINGVAYSETIWESTTENTNYLKKNTEKTLNLNIESSLFGADSIFGTNLENIQVCIDSNANIAESNEENNCASYTF